MKDKMLFNGVRVPEPPQDLRQKVLANAKNVVARPGANRSTDWFPSAGLRWAAAIAVLLLLALFWNPPLPRIPGAKQVSPERGLDPEIRWAMNHTQSARPGADSANVIRALQGEKL